MTTAVCRECGGETIASLDHYTGNCRGSVEIVDGKPQFEPAGWTEIGWDTCEQVGWICVGCGTMLEVETAPGGSEVERDQLIAMLLARMVIPVVG